MSCIKNGCADRFSFKDIKCVIIVTTHGYSHNKCK